MQPVLLRFYLRSRLAAGLMLTLIVLVGCQKKTSHERLAIAGTVNLNGRPLEFGSILFIPKAGNPGPKAGGTIRRGDYLVPQIEGPMAGELDVKIYAPKFAPETILPDDIHEIQKLAAHASELLPPEYNAKTRLSVTAVKDGPNRFNFDLEMALP